METERRDIHQRVTNQIIEAIERGVERCRMPWHITDAEQFSPVNAVSKRPYRGVNVLNLWAVAEHRGYPSGLWATFEQWRQMEAQVRRGEKSCPVVFWKVSERSEETEESEEEGGRGRRFFARGYHVFNAAQVEGFTPEEAPKLPETERIERAERFVGALVSRQSSFDRCSLSSGRLTTEGPTRQMKIDGILGADIRHGAAAAGYRREDDVILMPRFEAFRDGVAYYSNLAHELTHWTGATPRLNRNLSGRFGDNVYAAEELIAELGAAFVCAGLKLTNEPRPDHAAYIESWLTLLKNDNRAIFTAASKAQAAVDWMHGKQGHASAAA